MFADLARPTIFGHRGASAYAPENTIAAFKLAIEQGAEAIELDTMLSRDGMVVVIHDPTINRTTNGEGKVVDFTIDELKEFDAGILFGESYTGERIPTLNEVFESVGNKTFINIELKNYLSPLDRLTEKVAKLVKHHNLEERILFSSFSPLALVQIQRILPTVPIGLLATPGITGAWARSFIGRWLPFQAIHPGHHDTNQELIQKCHNHGFRVHAYTINDRKTMMKLFSWNIDGIITDDVLLARQVLISLGKN